MIDRQRTPRRRHRASCALALLCAVLIVYSPSPQAADAALTVAIADRALQPGELIVVRIADRTAAPNAAPDADRTVSDVRVTIFGKTTRAFPDGGGWTALVGIDLDQPPGPYVLTTAALRGSTAITAAQPLVVRPKRFATRTLRVAPEFVNPPPATAARIAADVSLLNRVYAHSAHERSWQHPFVRPVPQEANSRFGQRSRFNGELRSPHAGTDFMSPAGTPVKAPNAGRIVVAQDLYFTGNTVVIDHGLGMFSMLAHLSRVEVREGEQVNAGDVIGLVGATGRVTGPHLHWALRIDGARIDPMSALALLGDPPAAVH